LLSRADDEVTGHVLGLRATPTLVRLSSSRAGVPEGQPLALAARVVSVGADDLPPATGEVSFLVDGRRVGTAPVGAGGEAVLDGLHLGVGVHAVVASYSGDERHAAATSAPLPQAVTASATPVVLLVATPTRSPEGVVLEAEVVDPHTGRLAEAASGEVVFIVKGKPVGTVPLASGQARLHLDRLPAGRLRATYSGDREHAAADGSPEDPYPGKA
jgi:hypothetical protein